MKRKREREDRGGQFQPRNGAGYKTSSAYVSEKNVQREVNKTSGEGTKRHEKWGGWVRGVCGSRRGRHKRRTHAAHVLTTGGLWLLEKKGAKNLHKGMPGLLQRERRSQNGGLLTRGAGQKTKKQVTSEPANLRKDMDARVEVR